MGISDLESVNRYIRASKLPPARVEITENLEHIDTRHPLVKAVSKMFPTKPKAVKPTTEIKGPITPSPEEVIFGRDNIIADIKADIAKGQSVLLTGPLGIGKTHLLKHMLKVLGPNTIYISSPTPLKTALMQILVKLDPEWNKTLNTRASTKDITDYIVKDKRGKASRPAYRQFK